MANLNLNFFGWIKKGKFYFDNKNQFDLYVGSFNDCKAIINIKKDRAQRTSGRLEEKSNQNGYYWAVIIPILGDHFGYTPEEMHHAIKNKFLRIGGSDELPKVKGSSSLNKIDWEEFTEQIRVWALTEYNIKIPLPNEIKISG